MAFNLSEKYPHRQRIDPVEAAAALAQGERDEVLCVKAFAKCRGLRPSKAFERLASQTTISHRIGTNGEHSITVSAGATPGERALTILQSCCAVVYDATGYRLGACEVCGVTHFSAA